jgi:hypothetical protein
VHVGREVRYPLEECERDRRRRELVGEVLADEPSERLPLAQHEQASDNASGAVSEDEQRNPSSLAGADQGHEVGKVGHVIIECVDVIALTVRLAVAAQVGGVHREPLLDELLGRPLVHTAVGLPPVHDDDDSARGALRAPRAMVEARASTAAEEVFLDRRCLLSSVYAMERARDVPLTRSVRFLRLIPPSEWFRRSKKGFHMNTLAQFAIDAHGGLDRWRRFSILTAHLARGGKFWATKHKAGVLDDTIVTVDLVDEKVFDWPVGSPPRRSLFEPGRVALEDANGALLEELRRPRSSFEGHGRQTFWTDLQLIYFAGYAMWTYLNTPFLLARPGVESEELEPWQENSETWRRLRARFPEDIATHSRDQTLYFDRTGMLRRHDYQVEVDGGAPGAHYVYEPKEFSGIVFPTKRRIFVRGPDGRPAPEPPIISIDVDHVILS